MGQGQRQKPGVGEPVLQARLQSIKGLTVWRAAHAQSKLPMREGLEKFIQTKNALPTMF